MFALSNHMTYYDIPVPNFSLGVQSSGLNLKTFPPLLLQSPEPDMHIRKKAAFEFTRSGFCSILLIDDKLYPNCSHATLNILIRFTSALSQITKGRGYSHPSSLSWSSPSENLSGTKLWTALQNIIRAVSAADWCGSPVTGLPPLPRLTRSQR